MPTARKPAAKTAAKKTTVKSAAKKNVSKVLGDSAAAKAPGLVSIPPATKVFVEVGGRMREFVTRDAVSGRFTDGAVQSRPAKVAAKKASAKKASDQTGYKVDQPGKTKKVELD